MGHSHCEKCLRSTFICDHITHSSILVTLIFAVELQSNAQIVKTSSIFFYSEHFLRRWNESKVNRFQIQYNNEWIHSSIKSYKKVAVVPWISRHYIKTGVRSGDWIWKKRGPLKNGHGGKIGPQGLKPLLFFSSHMKCNVEVIHFHIKSEIVQGLVFV